MRNFCHSCKFCTLTISVIKANPSIDNRFRSTCQKRFDYVSKKSRKRVNRTTSLIIRLEYVLKTSSKRLEDVLEMSWRHFCRTPWKFFEYLLKTSSQDVLKMSRCLEDVFARRFEDILKTSWKRLEDVLKIYDQDEYIGLDQDVLKTSWRRFLKTHE